MLVTSGHPEVLVTKELRNNVNVCPLHPEPVCGGVAQIMESKVLNLQLLAEPLERYANESTVQGDLSVYKLRPNP